MSDVLNQPDPTPAQKVAVVAILGAALTPLGAAAAVLFTIAAVGSVANEASKRAENWFLPKR